MKKYILFFIIFLSIISVFYSFNIVYAAEDTLSDIFSDGDKFLEAENNKNNNGILSDQEMQKAQDQINDASSIIYNVLFGIGMVVAVVVGSILGIQFMISTVDEKAEIKKTLIVYVVGCVILFGAFGIWKIVVNLLKDV